MNGPIEDLTAKKKGAHDTGGGGALHELAPRGDGPRREASPVEAAPGLPGVQQRRATRRFFVLGTVAGVVLLGIAGYLLLTAGRETTDDAQIMADTVPLASRVAGQVKSIAIQENQSVKQGDLLVVLDDADYAARTRQAEAELLTQRAQAAAAEAQVKIVEATSRGGLASARAQVSGSSVGVSSALAQVAAARAGLQRAEAEARKAELDFQRAQSLRRSNVIAQATLDNTKTLVESARAALSQVKAQLAAANEGMLLAKSHVSEARGRLGQSEPIDAQIAAAHANAELAKARVLSSLASLELAKLQLSYTRIIAPADGVVSKLSVRPGQLVQVGQQMMGLVPIQTYVVANFKETQIGKMRPGQLAEIEIDTFSGRTLAAKVESLSGGTGATFALLPPDNTSGNFVKVVQRVPVRLSWVNLPADLQLRAGLSAEVTVRVR